VAESLLSVYRESRKTCMGMVNKFSIESERGC
jgi:hypothetical protein